MDVDAVYKRTADLIIVGAGPAGSSAAYHAARGGLDVVMVDREHFPRDKPCGDALLPHAVNEIEKMGLSAWLSDCSHSRFERYCVYTPTASFEHQASPVVHGKEGYVIPRKETDAKLLEQAQDTGAEFRPGVNARKVIRNPTYEVTGIEATSQENEIFFEAPLVIAADGVGGFAADGLKAPQNGLVQRQYFTNIGGQNKGQVHFWFPEDLLHYGVGYGWIFFLGDGRANVGAGLYKEALKRSPYTLSEHYERFLERVDVQEILNGAEPESPAKSWSLKMGMSGARRYAQGLMLAGDAGSMIHPFSGEGVGYALESGRLAGLWAAHAHDVKDYSEALLSRYERGLRRIRGSEHPPALFVANKIFNRFPEAKALEHILQQAEIDSEFRRSMIESFAGDARLSEVLSYPRPLCRAAFAAVNSQIQARVN